MLRLVFFLSGAAGLVYEVAWTREMARIGGSTAEAMALVFATFLAALAAGAALAGRLGARGQEALRLYAGLEVAVALLGYGAGRLLQATTPPLPLALALIALPTLAMGATLPLVLAAVPRPRAQVAALYGTNTLGAATGALAAGFFLIGALGLRGTLLAAAGLNLLAASGALLLTPEAAPRDADAPASQAPLGLAFLSGLAVLGSEVLWGRLAHFLLGDRTLAVSALLALFLAGLGLGSLLAGRLRTARPATLMAFAAVVQAGFAALAFQALDTSPDTAPRLLRTAALVLPPATALGLVFPTIMKQAEALERRAGALYAVNTAGAVLGGLAVGFLVPTPAGFVAMNLLLVAAALPRPLALAAAALVVAPAFTPGWTLFRLLPDERLVTAREDRYGAQVMAETRDGAVRLRNNRVQLVWDLGDPQTTHAQAMAAHLATLLAEDPSRVANLGTGYGITAGTFLQYEAVHQLTTVELLPFLVDLQPRFADHNFGYLGDSRARLVQADGRRWLRTAGGGFGVLSVNVLDPYLPGSSGLYTLDFWREARQRLAPGGVYVQLFWGPDVPLLLRGLRQVFPEVLCFPAYGGTSFNVVAADGPRALHLDRLDERARAALRRVTEEPGEDFLRQALAEAREITPHLLEGAAPGPLHTDDHPVLETRWSHGAPGVSALDSPLVDR